MAPPFFLNRYDDAETARIRLLEVVGDEDAIRFILMELWEQGYKHGRSRTKSEENLNAED